MPTGVRRSARGWIGCDVVSVDVSVRQVGDIVVLRISGTAGDELIGRLADGMAAVAETTAALVVELHDLVLGDMRAVRTLACRLLALPAECVAVSCGRLSGRRLLRYCVGARLDVFIDTNDAVAAARARRLRESV
jgi:hypothetical protein